MSVRFSLERFPLFQNRPSARQPEFISCARSHMLDRDNRDALPDQRAQQVYLTELALPRRSICKMRLSAGTEFLMREDPSRHFLPPCAKRSIQSIVKCYSNRPSAFAP